MGKTKSFLLGTLLLVLVGSCAQTGLLPSQYVSQKDGRYANPGIIDPEKDVFDFFSTKFFGDEPFADQSAQVDRIKTSTDLVDLKAYPGNARITWIGHSTFLISYKGVNILTDPIFSDRASPVSFAGPKRLTPAPYLVLDLPPIHHVIISHNHYDHLDAQSIEQLGNAPSYHVPLGLSDWFGQGFESNDYDWWQQKQWDVNGTAVTITATPTQHWSQRGLFDRRKTLWASWLIQIEDFTVWFAGDTGYHAKHFKRIGDKFPNIDLALIPIGSYAPSSFMQTYHVNPEEAVAIHEEVKAKQSFAMHWSTFPLSAEDVDAPNIRLRAAMADKQNPEAFVSLKIGETRYLTASD